MTEVALIPPTRLMRYAQARPLQMLLPACFEDPNYRLTHARTEGRVGYYRILDNGMFESGRPTSNFALLDMGKRYGVNEVVMPDVRNDAFGTYQTTQRFLEDYWAWVVERHEHDWAPAFMVVLQGETLREMQDLLQSLAGLLPKRTIIGFPRFLTRQKSSARIELMERVVNKFGKQFQLHMLGLSREWPSELLRARRQFGDLLRGIDTDAPFVWAHNKRRITAQAVPDVERPPDYFSFDESQFEQDTLRFNIRTLEQWAAGLGV